MSSKKETHTQCHLQRGNVRQVSWIPSSYAVAGQFVKLKEKKINDKGIQEEFWDDGWEVTSVGSMTFPSKYIQERERDYKETRKASDI